MASDEAGAVAEANSVPPFVGIALAAYVPVVVCSPVVQLGETVERSNELELKCFDDEAPKPDVPSWIVVLASVIESVPFVKFPVLLTIET